MSGAADLMVIHPQRQLSTTVRSSLPVEHATVDLGHLKLRIDTTPINYHRCPDTLTRPLTPTPAKRCHPPSLEVNTAHPLPQQDPDVMSAQRRERHQIPSRHVNRKQAEESATTQTCDPHHSAQQRLASQSSANERKSELKSTTVRTSSIRAESRNRCNNDLKPTRQRRPGAAPTPDAAALHTAYYSAYGHPVAMPMPMTVAHAYHPHHAAPYPPREPRNYRGQEEETAAGTSRQGYFDA
ncbi:hypothetical protein BDK51DRAFT_42619, partial [Blyttiomyces helicus]